MRAILLSTIQFCILAAACTLSLADFRQNNGAVQRGRVIAVADGDTITVLVDRSSIRVRLHGIDCPERGQDFSAKAKAATARKVFEKEVELHTLGTDRYGRTLGRIAFDRRSLNEDLVAEGYCWWYRKYAADDRTLERLERHARSEKRGLWALPGAIAPWEYRGRSWERLQQAPSSDAKKPIIGNRRSSIYHWPGCPHYLAVAPHNRRYFKSTEEAEAAGFRAAKNCR